MCKALGKTPKQLKREFDAFDWHWAIKNVQQDQENKGKEINNVLEYLQPWLNPQLFALLQKRKEQGQGVSVDYISGLLEHGMSEEEVEKDLEDQGLKKEEIEELLEQTKEYMHPDVEEITFIGGESEEESS